MPNLPQRYTPLGAEIVLLVEDEPSVRTLIREFLESTGYVVLEAESGRQALELAQAHAGPIHLLVTDVVMPRMSGHELARRLGVIRPEMQVLCMSGYSPKMGPDLGVSEEKGLFIQKPFTLEALLKTVREALDSGE